MSSLKRKVRTLQWRNSKACIAVLVISLVMVFLLSMALRFYALEPLQILDSSMYPRHKEKEFLWMCKLPSCIDKIAYDETVWASLRNGETVVRKVIGMPGDKIDFSDNGRVKTPHGSFRWKEETAFIQRRQVHIPRKGDTLRIAQLNDIEQDYFVTLLLESGVKMFVKTSLWQGDREIGIEILGSTKLGNRQVSLQEIDYPPWQDRFLLEEQVFHSEPGDAPIQIRREFFNEEDSTQITEFVVPEDCYFLACVKGAFCLDSREVGYFTKSHLLGRYLKNPRKGINFAKNIVTNLMVVKQKQSEDTEKTKTAPEGAVPEK